MLLIPAAHLHTVKNHLPHLCRSIGWSIVCHSNSDSQCAWYQQPCTIIWSGSSGASWTPHIISCWLQSCHSQSIRCGCWNKCRFQVSKRRAVFAGFSANILLHCDTFISDVYCVINLFTSPLYTLLVFLLLASIPKFVGSVTQPAAQWPSNAVN